MMRFPKRKARPLDEGGSVSPLAGVMCIALVFATAFAVDLGAQMLMAERQNSMMQVARETVEQAGNGFEVKNSGNGMQELSRQVCQSLKDQGFQGWAYCVSAEPQAGYAPTAGPNSGKTLRSDRRVIGCTVVMSETRPSVFAKLLGQDELAVHSSTTFTVMPYSSGTAWRDGQGPHADKAAYLPESGDVTTSPGSGAGIADKLASCGTSQSDIGDKALQAARDRTDAYE